MQINVNPELVNERFRVMLDNDTTYQLYYGGSSSSKSYSMFSLTPALALQGRAILIIRGNDAHINRSVWSEVNKAISRQNLTKYFTINKTSKTIESRLSRGSIQYSGVSDVERLKSITPAKADGFSVIIIEEATELTAEQFNQIVLRMRGKTGYKKRIILLFNPINKNHWIYKRFFEPVEDKLDLTQHAIEYTYDDVYIHKSTYRDNAYLSEEEINNLELMREVSPYHYQVYANGNFGVLGETVYDHYRTATVQELLDRDILEVLQDGTYRLKQGSWRAGNDNGWNDAITFTLSILLKDEIIVVGEFSRSKCPLPVYADNVKAILKKFNAEHIAITCDAEDPRSINTLKQYLRVKPAVKGAGSKLAGILWIKSKKLTIIDEWVPKTRESIDVYVWKKDASGTILDKTEHEGSDLLDALRYSLERDIRAIKTKSGRW